jgi:EAL domain-containing protein (putative c-di-GMP-specific phosphodiesterase class I)
MIPTRRTFLPITDEDGQHLAMMPVVLSEQCATCKHWTRNMQCEAFPELIPEAIRSGQFDHTRPFEGDHGIRYELADHVVDPGEVVP